MRVSSTKSVSFYFEGKKYIFHPGTWTVITRTGDDAEQRFKAFMEKVCLERAPLLFEFTTSSNDFGWFNTHFPSGPSNPCAQYLRGKTNHCIPCDQDRTVFVSP